MKKKKKKKKRDRFFWAQDLIYVVIHPLIIVLKSFVKLDQTFISIGELGTKF